MSETCFSCKYWKQIALNEYDVMIGACKKEGRHSAIDYSGCKNHKLQIKIIIMRLVYKIKRSVYNACRNFRKQ